MDATYASGKRVPDFFIVGHAKCGTTALYRLGRAVNALTSRLLASDAFKAR
jgi:hypothetical protein